MSLSMLHVVYFFRGGNGLDWFSRIRCAPLEDTAHTSSRSQQKEPEHHSTKECRSLQGSLLKFTEI